MLAQDCYGLISLGLWIRTVRNIDAKNSKSWTIKALKNVNTLLEKNNFVVALALTNGSNYSSIFEKLKLISKDDDPIGNELANKIVEEMSSLENVVFAESTTKKVYVLPERRFNSDYLLNNPSKLLKDGIFEKLDEIARLDITSACKCLLFGQATASAFHILRATEAVLKSYYFHHCKQNRLEKPMWGNMLTQLHAKKRNRPPSVLLGSLDLIRDSYRNPTQHPEAIYDIDRAQNLFGVCFDVIGTMGSEL